MIDWASGWAWVAASDGLARIAGLVALAATGLALLLLLAIAALRVRLEREQRRQQRFLATWRPLVAACVLEPPGVLPALAPRDEERFLQLWNHVHASVQGQARDSLKMMAQQLGLEGRLLQWLGRGSAVRRLLAVLTLGHLQCEAARPGLEPLVSHPDGVLSLAAARALLQIAPEATARRVLGYWAAREPWSTSRLGHALHEASAATVAAPLTELLAVAATDQARKVLRLLASFPQPSALPAVRELVARGPEPEVLAACLQLLREPSDRPLLRQHLDHPAWQVRLHATTSLGKVALEADVPELGARLGDPEWWVRYRAAEALAALPCLDEAELRTLQATHADRFARDMLQHLLDERRRPA